MKVKFIGESDPLCLINNKIYEIISIEDGHYRIIDETGEDYVYSPRFFEIVESLEQSQPQELGIK